MRNFLPKILLPQNKITNEENCSTYDYFSQNYSSRQRVIKCMHSGDHQEINRILEDIHLIKSSSFSYFARIEDFAVYKDDFDGWRVFLMRPKIKYSLNDIINAQIRSGNAPPDKEKVIKYFYLLATALESLQNRGIAHQNIKPTNILLDESERIFLIDLSMHRFKKDHGSLRILLNLPDNSLFIAPEVFSDNWPNSEEDLVKADVWSLGVVIVDLCLNHIKTDYPIISTKDKHLIMQHSLQYIKSIYGKSLSEAITHLLYINPAKRKSYTQIREFLDQNFSEILLKTRITSLEVQEDYKENTSSSVSSSYSAYNGIRNKSPTGKSQNKENWKTAVRTVEHYKKKSSWKNSFFKIFGLFLLCFALLFPNPKSVLIYFNNFQENIWSYKNNVEDIQDDIYPKIFQKIQGKWQQYFDIEGQDKAISIKTKVASKVNGQMISGIIYDIVKQIESSKLDDLEIFSLSGCTSITNEGLIQLTHYIVQYMRNLTMFSLDLYECEYLADQGLITLMHGLIQDLTELQDLILLLGCAQITDSSMIELSHDLVQHPGKFRKLYIDIIGGTKLTDKSINSLLTAVGQSQTDLEEFGFGIGRNKELTNEELLYFGSKVLGNLNSLKSLWLLFEGLEFFNDEVLTQLSSDLAVFAKNLEFLHIYINQCDNVTDQGFEYFGYMISQNLRNLKSVHLLTIESKGITNESKELIRNALSFVPDLLIT